MPTFPDVCDEMDVMLLATGWLLGNSLGCIMADICM